MTKIQTHAEYKAGLPENANEFTHVDFDAILDAIRTNHGVALDSYFGGIGDDETDDIEALTLAEASDFESIDLNGKTYLTTYNVTATPLTKKYYNGVLYVVEGGETVEAYLQGPVQYYEIARPARKSPIIDWENLKPLILGTSIEQEAEDDETDYITMACIERGTQTPVNMAWAGSRPTWSASEDPFEIRTVKTLSLTNATITAMLALHGASSAYDDSFDIVTLASQMTIEYRVFAPFAATPFDVVFLGHGHNGRDDPAGTLDPESFTIIDITKGATTTIEASAAGIVTEGMYVTLRVSSIASLNYFGGYVVSVSGAEFVLDVDSSGFSGTFSSGTGTFLILDVSTWYGSYDFIIGNILYAANLNGKPDCEIILMSPPSRHTGNQLMDHAIFGVGRRIERIAEKWGLAFYDQTDALNINYADHTIYIGDGANGTDDTHPVLLPQRQVMTNHLGAWMDGGAIRYHNPGKFLPAVPGATYTDGQIARYNRWTEAFDTRDYLIGATASVFADDFSAGIGSWTTNVGAVPTTAAAPWDAGETAITFTHDGSTVSYLQKTGLVFGLVRSAEFDVYLDDVEGLTVSESSTLVPFFGMQTGFGYYSLQFVVKSNRVEIRAQVFQEPSADLVSVSGRFTMAAATKYHIKVEMYQSDSGRPGALICSIDDVKFTLPIDLDDATQNSPTRVRLGLISSNTGLPFVAKFANFDCGSGAITTIYSGTFDPAAVTAITVVNGAITSVS